MAGTVLVLAPPPALVVVAVPPLLLGVLLDRLDWGTENALTPVDLGVAPVLLALSQGFKGVAISLNFHSSCKMGVVLGAEVEGQKQEDGDYP